MRPPGRRPTEDGLQEGHRGAATASPGQGKAFCEHQSIRFSFPLSNKENSTKLTIGKSLKYGRSIVAFSLPSLYGQAAHALLSPGQESGLRNHVASSNVAATIAGICRTNSAHWCIIRFLGFYRVTKISCTDRPLNFGRIDIFGNSPTTADKSLFLQRFIRKQTAPTGLSEHFPRGVRPTHSFCPARNRHRSIRSGMTVTAGLSTKSR